MITLERVNEAVRQYEVLTSIEKNADKKQFMAKVLSIMKISVEEIVKSGDPCPPEIEAELDEYLKWIESEYLKNACN